MEEKEMISDGIKRVKKKISSSGWFRKDNLVITVLAGILLLVIALPTRDTNEKNNVRFQQENSTAEREQEEEISQAEESGKDSLSEYEKNLETRLCRILEGMYGAGAVEVMITFCESEELVALKDNPTTGKNTVERDAQGGSRSVYESGNTESTVYKSTEGAEEPFVVKKIMPKVEGVLVAAQGAGNTQTAKQISDAVQALFGIEAHKVKVIRMKD